jgi:site-specific DNA-cytosine methylase
LKPASGGKNSMPSWYVKTIRSGARAADGSLPADVWTEGVVHPTLNVFDVGDTRAVVIVVEDEMPAYPIQGTVIGRKDTAGPQGKGHGEADDPMYTLDTTGGHAVAMTEDDDTIVFHPHRTDGFRIQGDTVNTLTAFMGTGGLNTPMVSTSKVRRLTPVECERLQGFPDGWTAVDEKTADSHRYKQMGNAVTVNVLTWVGSRID